MYLATNTSVEESAQTDYNDFYQIRTGW